MKQFDMLLPRDVAEAVRGLPTKDTYAERRRVKVLAGGQDLLGELKSHVEEPETVVNLKSVPGLDALERSPDGGATIGALATVAQLEETGWLRTAYPALAEAAATVASPQIRAAGTVGGNLCQRPRCWYYRSEDAICLKKGGDECFAYAGMNRYNAILGAGPSYIVHPSDLAPALVALEAEVKLQGPAGERVVRLEDFYTLPSESDVTKETVLAPNEVLTQVRIHAVPAMWRQTYLKVRERGAFDFALSAVAVALDVGDDGVVRNARIVLGGVAPRPWRVPAAEALLRGRKVDEAAIEAVREEALRGAEPLEHNAYKIPMTKGLITKALRKLA
jgi:xanthine dehydrogenase YagS FAD-binding subunit